MLEVRSFAGKASKREKQNFHIKRKENEKNDHLQKEADSLY